MDMGIVVSLLTLYLPCIFNYDMFNKHQLMHINFIHNSLLLKFPYTYFGGLNHHLQGVVEIILHRPYSYYIRGYIRTRI
jgi:hypothetical protein